MKLIRIKDLIKIITKDGWKKSDQTGSHLQYQHPNKKELINKQFMFIN